MLRATTSSFDPLARARMTVEQLPFETCASPAPTAMIASTPDGKILYSALTPYFFMMPPSTAVMYQMYGGPRPEPRITFSVLPAESADGVPAQIEHAAAAI